MKRTILFVFIAMLAASACVKEPLAVETTEESSQEAPVDAILTSFTATAEGAVTKTDLYGNDAEGYAVRWREWDAIHVTDAAGNTGTYRALAGGEITTSFTIKGSSNVNTSRPPFIAYYPETIREAARIWPSEQDYMDDGVVPLLKTVPMRGLAESIVRDEENVFNITTDFTFKNLGGLIRLNLKSTTPGTTVGKIILSADEGMSGPFNIAADGLTAEIESGTGDVTLYVVNVSHGFAVSLSSEPKPFYIAVPAGTYNNLKVTVVQDNMSAQTKTAKVPIVVERSKITDITLTFNDFALETTNLSASATANCYVVGRAGSYKFRADVAGNGAADLSGISKTISSVNSAELLWATIETQSPPGNTQLIRNVRYSDGFVFFDTGVKYIEGNALIAVKDASSNILWSWHIWFESDDLEALRQRFGSNVVFMDRNLGAIENYHRTDYYFDFGMYYEWGRKDPFPHQVNSSRTQTVARRGSRTTTTLESLSLAGTIANPTAVSSGGISGATWDTDSKNIFDPCPPGWKVPKPIQFTAQIAGKGVWQSGVGATITYGGHTAWYPAAGAFAHGSTNYYHQGEGAYLYTTTSAYSRSFDLSSSLYGSMQDKDSYWACSVRCVKEFEP